MQQITGGKFITGLANSALASMGSEITAHLDAQIREMRLSDGERSMMSLLSRPSAGYATVLQLPDVPTLQEQGLKDFDMPTWQGLFAPAGLPPHVLAAYSATLQDILKAPETREKMAALGSEPRVDMTSAQFAAFLQKDRQQWADIIKTAKIEPVP